MSGRNIIVVLNKMISFVPVEEDDLKRRLTNIMESHPYKADEININSWISTQACLENRFGEIKIDEMPEWVSQLLKVWTNTDQ